MLLFTRLRRRCVSFSNCIAQVLAVTRLRAHRTHLQHQAQERQEVRTLISATPVDLTVLAGAWSLPQNAAQTTSTADEGDPSELHLNRLSITGQNPTVTEDLSDSDQILTYFTINCDGDLAVDKSASVDVTHLLARTSFSDDVTDPLAAITATANSYPSVDCNGTTLTFHNLGTTTSSSFPTRLKLLPERTPGVQMD